MRWFSRQKSQKERHVATGLRNRVIKELRNGKNGVFNNAFTEAKEANLAQSSKPNRSIS